MRKKEKWTGYMLANKQRPVHVVYKDEIVCGILDHDPFPEGAYATYS